MAMPMVQIRIMGMAMNQPAVAMRVAVRFARGIVVRMGVLVVSVMNVPMGVLQRLMDVLVFMTLSQMKP